MILTGDISVRPSKREQQEPMRQIAGKEWRFNGESGSLTLSCFSWGPLNVMAVQELGLLAQLSYSFVAFSFIAKSRKAITQNV